MTNEKYVYLERYDYHFKGKEIGDYRALEEIKKLERDKDNDVKRTLGDEFFNGR